MLPPQGTGPGDIAPDGSAVEVYARLPAGPDLALLHASMPVASRILDLGAGTGRLADPLVALGHEVLAVDDCPAMLARVQRATTVTSRIEDLHLAERFDVVLLASHLINAPDAGKRRDLLAAVARHLRSDGLAFIQWHPPTWFDALDPTHSHTGTIGGFSSTLVVHHFKDGLLNATVSYEERPPPLQAAAAWSHTFTARRLALDQLEHEAAAVALTIHAPLPGAEHWLIATPSPREGCLDNPL